MFKKYTDNKLIEGIRLQDDKALKHIYNTYFQMVKNYVLKNSGNSDDAYDVFQESIIVLYKQVVSNELNLTSDLKGFFYGIARAVWLKALNKRGKNSELTDDITDESGTGYEADEAILERVVARVMEKLKPDCAEIIRLFSEGVDYGTIASTMGLKSEEYARRKKYLCKEALMELIKKDQEYRDHFERTL